MALGAESWAAWTMPQKAVWEDDACEVDLLYSSFTTGSNSVYYCSGLNAGEYVKLQQQQHAHRHPRNSAPLICGYGMSVPSEQPSHTQCCMLQPLNPTDDDTASYSNSSDAVNTESSGAKHHQRKRAAARSPANRRCMLHTGSAAALSRSDTVGSSDDADAVLDTVNGVRCC